uniref:Uncharacterized protein n=1 Tax=Anopheles dirus TaxID=7168 RepID=A0A182NY57_9DIPT
MARLMILLLCAVSIIAYSAAYRGQRHHGGSHEHHDHPTAPVKPLHPTSKFWPSTKQPPKSSNEVKSAYSKLHFPTPEPQKDVPMKHVHPISYQNPKPQADDSAKSDHRQDKDHQSVHKYL